MALVKTYSCDVCGVLRKDERSWLRVTVDPVRVVLWFNSQSGKSDWLDVCGERCAMKKLSELVSALVRRDCSIGAGQEQYQNTSIATESMAAALLAMVEAPNVPDLPETIPADQDD